MPADGIEINLGKGSASLEAFDVPIFDYGYIANSLFGGGPPPVPGTVSFKVVWSGVGERVNNPDNGFLRWQREEREARGRGFDGIELIGG